ncbi:MAG TPA: DUF1987 domain-containing protein [Bacteroidia bacterium]|nr:DUF1987 domain-containing protein [Bacteroidia bacterium]
MEKYSIDATANTPTIKFDLTKGELNISGRSIPENSLEFYNPLFEALDTYLADPNPKNATILNIQLEYYNSSSSACLLSVFKKLEKFNKGKGASVKINWIYEENDEDILAAGKNFEGMVDLPFQMIAISES